MKGELKKQAIKLRRKGFSMEEIHLTLSISKSTASLWTRNIKLSGRAQKRLVSLGIFGRLKGESVRREKREKLIEEINFRQQGELKKISKSIFLDKLLCSMLYWCEGEKTTTAMVFVNSDPELVKTFLRLFRSAFKLVETKFHVVVHLHAYHNETKQKQYWSQLTGIPQNQFHKIFWKKNGGKNIRKNYPGCVSIRYYDHKVAKELKQLWKIFSEQNGRVV